MRLQSDHTLKTSRESEGSERRASISRDVDEAQLLKIVEGCDGKWIQAWARWGGVGEEEDGSVESSGAVDSVVPLFPQRWAEINALVGTLCVAVANRGCRWISPGSSGSGLWWVVGGGWWVVGGPSKTGLARWVGGILRK
jgi:hypothetical protein